MYYALIKSGGLWKLKVPLKIKIFLWFSKKRVILTKNNFAIDVVKEALSVVFLMLLKQYNTCFMIAIWLGSFRIPLTFSSMFDRLLIYLAHLDPG
jgi:hypothetical protein